MMNKETAEKVKEFCKANSTSILVGVGLMTMLVASNVSIRVNQFERKESMTDYPYDYPYEIDCERYRVFEKRERRIENAIKRANRENYGAEHETYMCDVLSAYKDYQITNEWD